MNANTMLNRQHKNLNEHFERRVNEEVEKQLKLVEREKTKIIEVKVKPNTRRLYKDYEKLQDKYAKIKLENKHLILRVLVAEDAERRFKKKEEKLDTENKELKDENQSLKREIERLKAIVNLDGTTSGIPTSKTPIGKKKVVPNFAKNTGGKKGREYGHKKDKLEKVSEDKINEYIKHELDKCPNCDKSELTLTGKIITKQVKDYKIIVNYTEHEFMEYKCNCCGKTVHAPIPNHLKEDIQYGSNVKSIALTLSNVGNVALNKIRRILNGLSMEEIDPCEGYLVKLQKNASKSLTSFIEELHKACISSKILYWDDTVISIDKKQSCMRYYGNDFLCLFKAHEKKNKEGLDQDKILSLLDKNTVVEHDHNKVNYNPEYEFINAECCQHLLRDLKKVEMNLPNRTWCKEMIKLFQEYDHKRKELIDNGIEHFDNDEINEFILNIDTNLLKGLEENENDPNPYYADNDVRIDL